jgi:DNA-binding protein H-NS
MARRPRQNADTPSEPLETQDEPEMSDTDTPPEEHATQEGVIIFRGMPEEEIIHTVQSGLAELSPEGLSRCLNYIQDLRRSKEEEIKDDLMRQFRAMAERAGMPFERLFPTSRRSSTKQIAPKYRDDKGNRWTGRGQSPRWLTAYEAEGRNREEFRIRDEAAE